MVQLINPATGKPTEVKYEEHYARFGDADFVQSSSSPPNYFNCVAVAHKDGIVAVRSSYDDQKRTVFFNEDEWRSFIYGAKKGEFDFGIT